MYFYYLACRIFLSFFLFRLQPGLCSRHISLNKNVKVTAEMTLTVLSVNRQFDTKNVMAANTRSTAAAVEPKRFFRENPLSLNVQFSTVGDQTVSTRMPATFLQVKRWFEFLSPYIASFDLPRRFLAEFENRHDFRFAETRSEKHIICVFPCGSSCWPWS